MNRQVWLVTRQIKAWPAANRRTANAAAPVSPFSMGSGETQLTPAPGPIFHTGLLLKRARLFRPGASAPGGLRTDTRFPASHGCKTYRRWRKLVKQPCLASQLEIVRPEPPRRPRSEQNTRWPRIDRPLVWAGSLPRRMLCRFSMSQRSQRGQRRCLREKALPQGAEDRGRNEISSEPRAVVRPDDRVGVEIFRDGPAAAAVGVRFTVSHIFSLGRATKLGRGGTRPCHGGARRRQPACVSVSDGAHCRHDERCHAKHAARAAVQAIDAASDRRHAGSSPAPRLHGGEPGGANRDHQHGGRNVLPERTLGW